VLHSFFTFSPEESIGFCDIILIKKFIVFGSVVFHFKFDLELFCDFELVGVIFVCFRIGVGTFDYYHSYFCYFKFELTVKICTFLG
jgi:hypothetical protein